MSLCKWAEERGIRCPEHDLACRTPRAGFEQIYREHFEWVWRRLMKRGFTQQEAEEAAQDIFLGILARDMAELLNNPGAYLSSAVEFKARRRWKQNSFREGCQADIPKVYLPLQAGWLLYHSILQEVFSWKSGTTKDVTLLKLFLDAKLVEIQEVLGLSQVTAQMAWTRGQLKLKDWLSGGRYHQHYTRRRRA